MKKFLLIFGTRPEAIKFAPLVKELKKHSDIIDVRVCVTGQHQLMLDQVLSFFDIVPDYNLALMKPSQTLYDITTDILQALKGLLTNDYPADYVIVQGDTTTAMAAALASFYNKTTVLHLEAGLRSHDSYSPFPEEINRAIVARLASYHFAPTEKAKQNLIAEGIRERDILMCGNTVIDSLFLGLDIIDSSDEARYREKFSFLDFDKKIILVTGHRRENFGEPFLEICNAIKQLAEENPAIQIVYPVHLNPNVQEPVNKVLQNVDNVFLIPPIEYNFLIWLMKKSYFIITDSGGIQEEAPALGKPVLVMREVTERTEGIEAGTAKLVGTSKNNIMEAASELLASKGVYDKMANAVNPYGDGTTSRQIADFVLQRLINEN
ncbi:MAG: UDP-N-acetylglucosamine 2-epimerase (non-hydrolyzing) [Chitinophagaceae bacterium]